MRIEIAGFEHRLLVEPTPSLIDGLVREQVDKGPVGSIAISGIEAEELEAIYRVNGWSQLAGCAYKTGLEIPEISVFEGLVKPGSQGEKRLIGPYILGRTIMQGGLALWAQSTA